MKLKNTPFYVIVAAFNITAYYFVALGVLRIGNNGLFSLLLIPPFLAGAATYASNREVKREEPGTTETAGDIAFNFMIWFSIFTLVLVVMTLGVPGHRNPLFEKLY